jgi:hypothetical protein
LVVPYVHRNHAKNPHENGLTRIHQNDPRHLHINSNALTSGATTMTKMITFSAAFVMVSLGFAAALLQAAQMLS